MIHLLTAKATPEQMAEMLVELGDCIKVAVDIRREILVGGGEKHVDCEQVLLDHGSAQENLWGATWWAGVNFITHESMINLRPQQRNFSMMIQDQAIRERVTEIIRHLLENV